ncbi:hypothetical protein [Beggiatoa leptomitoformis]|uniref:Uncharacterized protein n=1 Tax=Beggiatoa leptomitoformis TaxID=288004 RepID=A0A2N9YGQ7_9GAMM|nr:hypothetical protein [Beggiatoa leptomitoformis]ALG68007.1 hypothetical protein AL038_10175 [Beggiatoa leptomitoformis]AUI69708.1 hypothetical protein BLE401_14105 [Beggiatoa leptomitoformis]
MHLQYVKNLLFVCLLVWQSSSFAAINGVWIDNNSNYWLLMQDTKNQVIGVQIESDLSGTTTFLGLLDNQQLSLQSLTSDDVVTATLNDTETHFSGTVTEPNNSYPIEADLILAYEGGQYDGVWQTSLDHYLAYVTVNSNNTTVAMVIDVLIDPDGTLTSDIFVGNVREGSFTGTSLKELTKTLRLVFTNTPVTGSYIILTNERPPKTETQDFTATQIFTIQQSSVN